MKRPNVSLVEVTIGDQLGRVFSVERESTDSVEVNVRRPNGTFEVQLDSGHVVEVEAEDPADE